MEFSSCKKIVLAIAVITLVAGSLHPVSVLAGEQKNSLLVRLRLLDVVPDDSSTAISAIGGNAEVDATFAPDLDFTYFFTDNFALELTLALTNNDVEAVNTAAGNLDLGDVYLLPPTLTVQYHFLPNNTFRPYVGAGVNYTVFFDGDSGVANDVEYDNAIGVALQAGFDFALDDHWAINVDVKKLWLSTDVTVKALGTIVETEVDIDPWLLGLGVAYRF